MKARLLRGGTERVAASITSITAVSYDAKNIANQGAQRSQLSVWFHVYSRGPAHVAGIVVSTDGWITRNEVTARFDHFEGNGEVWNVEHSVQGNGRTFAFVCWCEDYADVTAVKKVWNMNNGSQFWDTANHF